MSQGLIWMTAAVLGGLCLVRGGDRARRGVAFAFEQLILLLPRIFLAIIAASFLAVIIPQDMIGPYMGRESGVSGIFFATLAGAMVPGGPMVAYPLAVVFFGAGAGTPQIVAFLSAWSIFALHRILLFEMNLVGWRFTALRLISSLPIPILAGLIASRLTLFAW